MRKANFVRVVSGLWELTTTPTAEGSQIRHVPEQAADRMEQCDAPMPYPTPT